MIEHLILAALAVALLIVHDRAGKRHHETERAHRLELAGLTERMAREREAHRAEVAQLCQRIQAPELAVVEHQQAGMPDENPYPLTDDQIAEAQERAAAIERIEQIANEGLFA